MLTITQCVATAAPAPIDESLTEVAMPEIGPQSVPYRADHHTSSPFPQDGTIAIGDDAPKVPENDTLHLAEAHVVDSKLGSSTTSQVEDLWARCDAPLTSLKEQVAKLPDGRSRKALEREVDACIDKLDRAKKLAGIIAHRAAVAKDPSGVGGDELMQMWREMKRADKGVFSDLDKQISRLAGAVEEARLPAGPLKVSIVTLVATAVTMVAAALLSFALPPLAIPLIFGAGVLVGTTSVGYLAAACWRSGDLPEDRLRGLHDNVRTAIDGVLKTHESLKPLLKAAAAPHLERHANRVARDACEGLLHAAMQRPVPRFDNNQDWRQPYPYLHEGAPVVSETRIIDTRRACANADPLVVVLKASLSCIAREEFGRGTEGGINQATAAELAEKRLTLLQELQDTNAERAQALEPHMEAMEQDINTFILAKSQGREDTAAALDFLLSPAPQRVVCEALSHYLGARVGLGKDEPNPLQLYVQGDLVQTDVKVGQDGSVTARVTFAAHASKDGAIWIESSIGSALVAAGEDLRAEATLQMANGKCTVQSVMVTASDGVIDAAMRVCKLASLERLVQPAPAVTNESRTEPVAETQVDRQVPRPRSIRSTVADLPRPMPQEVGAEIRAASGSKRVVPAPPAVTSDSLAVEAAAWAQAQLQVFNEDYAKWDKQSYAVQDLRMALGWAARLKQTAKALKHHRADSEGQSEYDSLLGLLVDGEERAEPIGRTSSESQQAVEQALLCVDGARRQVQAYVASISASLNIGAGMAQGVRRVTNPAELV